MNDRYIQVMLMGTKDNKTDEFQFIPLYAKAGDLSGIAGFMRRDISGIPGTPEKDYIPAGTMAVFDPEQNGFIPIQLYALFKEWLDLTIIASEHITETEDSGNEGN